MLSLLFKFRQDTSLTLRQAHCGSSAQVQNPSFSFGKIQNITGITFNLEDRVLSQIFQRWSAQHKAFFFEGFKHYWNDYREPVFLYVNWKHKLWKDIDENDDLNYYLELKKGIDMVIEYYREISGK